jgi:BrnA antitoxin of type II toxin-antitoxin system
MKGGHDFSKGKRGAVVSSGGGKTRITIRIDDEVLGWFRQQAHAAGGGSYQTMLNAALRAHIAGSREPLAKTLRTVIREELSAYRAGRR